MTRWVVDTGPLIFLAKLDLLNLLQSGAGEVFIPPAVLDEVRVRGELSSVQEEVEKLKQMGFWVNDDLAKAVIQAAGEIAE